MEATTPISTAPLPLIPIKGAEENTEALLPAIHSFENRPNLQDVEYDNGITVKQLQKFECYKVIETAKPALEKEPNTINSKLTTRQYVTMENSTPIKIPVQANLTITDWVYVVIPVAGLSLIAGLICFVVMKAFEELTDKTAKWELTKNI